MRQHPRALAEGEISPARYEELKSICRQYREMRMVVSMAERYGHHRALSGDASRDRELPEARRVRIIEQTAMAAGGEAVGPAILRNVTEGQIYAKLRPPCGERQFYQLRLEFYRELDKQLWRYECGL